VVSQDTSQWAAKNQGKVKRFLGNGIAELNLEVPAGAEKVTIYDQTDGSELVVPRFEADRLTKLFRTITEDRDDGTFATYKDPTRTHFAWTPPPEIESSVGSAAETVSKISGKKRKRGKRGRR
tara:strand:- start:238 stop:606 length:369 start_codon:yes stop_codon:yes gene_type:complete